MMLWPISINFRSENSISFWNSLLISSSQIMLTKSLERRIIFKNPLKIKPFFLNLH